MFSLKVGYLKEFYACLLSKMFISSGVIVCLTLGLLVCVCEEESVWRSGGGLFIFLFYCKKK